MSRAYRIAVRESLRRMIRAGDHISTDLEILDILPRAQMGELLAGELEGRGFAREGQTMVRTTDGVTVKVAVDTGAVTVQAELQDDIKVEGERVGRSYDEAGQHSRRTREGLRKELRDDLEKQVQDKEAELQSAATDKLEGTLCDLRQELDQAVNRVTAEALKQKAAQLGAIKEMTEDPQSGSLTIVVEV